MSKPFPIYVKLIGAGGLLSCEGFVDITEARTYIRSELIPILSPGDTITVEESD